MLSKLYILSLLLFLAFMLMMLAGCKTTEADLHASDVTHNPSGANHAEDAKSLAINLIAKNDARLKVSSGAFAPSALIPSTYSAYGENVSPPLQWSEPPKGTQSFVVLMEDPDAAEPKPFVHWVIYNLPATTRELRAGIPTQARVADIGQPEQGQNSRGNIGYFGPKPPKGDPAHHYHFQVFALDQRLDVPLGSPREKVLEAMRPHVLAEGETVGRFAKAKD